MERKETVEWVTVAILGLYVIAMYESQPIVAGVAGVIALLFLSKLLFEPIGELVEENRGAFDTLLLVLIVVAILLSLWL